MRICVAVNDQGRRIGEDHPNAKYLDDDVERVRAFRSEGYTWARIAEMMDMPVRTVRSYVDGSRRSQSVAGFRWVKPKKALMLAAAISRAGRFIWGCNERTNKAIR